MNENIKVKSSRKLGMAFQYRCVQLIKKLYPGASIHNQTSSSIPIRKLGKNGKWESIWISRRNDIFGCDILVLTGEKTIFIQCTLHKSFEEKLKELVKYNWNLEHICVQVWMGKPSGEIEVRELKRDDPEYWLETLGKIIRGKFYELRTYI